MRSRPICLLYLGLVVLLLAPLRAEEGRRHLRRPEPTLSFSEGVLVGDTLYLSGRLGLEPGTRKVPESVEREVELLLDGMSELLAGEGMTMDDLVSVQVFCTDLSLYATFNEIYRGYFHGAFPARAFVGSSELLFGAHFEVMGIAVRQPAP